MPSSLNGTGVTFNDATTLQSGNIPAANLGSGTASSSTFLRGDKTWATVPASAPSTADVLAAYAGATAGAVGTYRFAFFETANTFLNVNATTAGSNLFTRATNTTSFAINTTGTGSATFLSGTWRYLGQSNIFTSGFDSARERPPGLFLRIS